MSCGCDCLWTPEVSVYSIKLIRVAGATIRGTPGEVSNRRADLNLNPSEVLHKHLPLPRPSPNHLIYTPSLTPALRTPVIKQVSSDIFNSESRGTRDQYTAH